MELSELKIGQEFVFKGKTLVYRLEDIKAMNDYFNTLVFYYSPVGSFKFYSWKSNQRPKKVTVVY